MKKYLLSSFLVLFSFLLAVAAPVDEQQARKIASDFLRGKMPHVTRAASGELIRAVTGVADGDNAGIYVFNNKSGFVVISADDELPAVLAYGTSRPYDAQTAPPAMKAMLEAYHYAATRTVKTRADIPTHADISPMIKTNWDQLAPYNNECPTDGETGEKCPTGCVATAMAQLMYYYKWPNTFNWDVMKATYSSTDSGEAVDAVAKLMADVGKNVFMSYASGASSANEIDACEALRYNYGYAETTDLIERSCYTVKAWDEAVYNELKANRPVFYVGVSTSSGQGVSGHAFILDGYQVKDNIGYFHVNWGWSGSSDDYFLISLLDPDEQYTGGNAGSSGYSFMQAALVGVGKGDMSSEKSTCLSEYSCKIFSDKGTYTRQSSEADFPGIQLLLEFYNLSGPTDASRYYDVAYGLYQDQTLVEIIDSVSLKEVYADPLKYGYGASEFRTNSLAFGKGLTDGTYQLRLLCRESGKKKWHRAIYSTCRYVELNINGNTMTTNCYGKFSEEDVSKFEINSVSVSEDCEVGKPIAITVNVTDKNRTNNAPIFLYGNASFEQGENNFQLLAGGGTNLDAGETGDVVLKYTPQRGGKFVFYLSGDYNELTDSLYRFEVNVSGLALQMDMEVEGAKINTSSPCEVPGTELKGKITLSNYSSEVYNDKVVIIPFEIVGYELNELEQSVVTTCNIAVGGQQDVPFNFTGLTVNSTYTIIVAVPDNGKAKYLNYDEKQGIKYIHIFTMVEDTAIKDIQIDSPDADVYDMRGVRLGKASALKSLPKGIYIINKKKVVNK